MIDGIDISNLQGPPAAYRGAAWYQAAAFVIVQAIPRPAPNGLCADQLQAALDDGKHRALYTWLWHDPMWRLSPDVAEDQRIRLATAGDVPCTGRPWLDCEDNQSTNWQAASVAQRRSDVLQALAALKAWADARGLPQPGIYSSDYFRDLLYGGTWDWLPPGTVRWMAHYGITPGSLIGGPVVGHQYTSEPIDRDLFLESEFITPEADVVIPQPYVDKFHLSNNQDVQGLIDNFEGVITTVQQIAYAQGEQAATDAEAKLAQIRQIVGSPT